MELFREWAVRVATCQYNPEWVTPVAVEGMQGFAFSLEAYNYFAQHSGAGLKTVEDEEELYSLLKLHSKHLYSGKAEIKLGDSGLFMLPEGFMSKDHEGNENGENTVMETLRALG